MSFTAKLIEERIFEMMCEEYRTGCHEQEKLLFQVMPDPEGGEPGFEEGFLCFGRRLLDWIEGYKEDEGG